VPCSCRTGAKTQPQTVRNHEVMADDDAVDAVRGWPPRLNHTGRLTEDAAARPHMRHQIGQCRKCTFATRRARDRTPSSDLAPARRDDPKGQYLTHRNHNRTTCHHRGRNGGSAAVPVRAPSAAKPRGSSGRARRSLLRQTRCWRGMDSNHRYPEDKLPLRDGLLSPPSRFRFSNGIHFPSSGDRGFEAISPPPLSSPAKPIHFRQVVYAQLQ
jgi:hypothetical protein